MSAYVPEKVVLATFDRCSATVGDGFERDVAKAKALVTLNETSLRTESAGHKISDVSCGSAN